MAKDEEVKQDKKGEAGEEKEAEGAEGAEGAKKGGKFSPKALLANKRKLVMIAGPLILVIILVVVYLFVLKPSGDDEPVDKAEQVVENELMIDPDVENGSGDNAEEGDGDAFFGGDAKILEMKPFVVNLQDHSGTRYLKLTIGVELDSNQSKKRLKRLKPKVRNSLIILLSSKSFTEIGSIQGKYKLRDEIVDRINYILQGDKVKTVYFTEFVVQ